MRTLLESLAEGLDDRMRDQEQRRLPQSVGVIAGPRIFLRTADHPGADRIELDISVTGQQILSVVDDVRVKPTIPQGSGSAPRAINELRVALAEIFHQARRGVRRPRRQQ